MVDGNNEHQQFSAQLPFYVNGTLAPQEREWMDAYLAAHPQAAKELQFAKLMRETTRATQSGVPEAQRLARLRTEWKPLPSAPSVLGRVQAWLQRMVPIPMPAMALASVLVLVQAAVIGTLLTGQPEEGLYRSDRPECAATPAIRVQFNPDAKHADVLVLLRMVQATIQSGPTETGALWLGLPKDRSPEEALAMLQSSALVEEAVLIRERRQMKECTR